MPASPDAARLTAYLEPLLPRYLDELTQLCAIDCPTAYKPGVDEAGAWVRQWVERRGWPVRTFADAEAGDGLAITVSGHAAGGPRILLAAHLDTVYPIGTVAAHPVRLEDGRFHAPGAADNKSGLLSALYALAALEDLGLLDRLGAVTLACGGDEEAGMRASTELLCALASDATVGFVLEAGRESGNIVSARKGIGQWQLDVTGRPAHAGVEPHKGASAILTLAQQTIALHLLNGVRPGVTVNVGVVSGGTVPNVVSAHARAHMDVRIAHPDDMDLVAAAIERIANTPYVPGTSTVLHGGWHLPPMPRTPTIAALVAQAHACASDLDFALSDTGTGGVSYANLLAGQNLPVLDGLGPCGANAHNADLESVLVSTIVPRTALLALLMVRQAM